MEIIKEKIMEHKCIYFIMFVSIIFIIIYFVFGIKTNSQRSLSNDFGFPSKILENQTVYTQYFKSNVDSLSEVGIKFSTYTKENKDGTLVINLYDDQDKLIKSSDIALEDVKDNQTVYLEFDKIKKSFNKMFRLEFYYKEYNNDLSVAYWYTKANQDNYLMVNNEKNDESINLVLVGKAKDSSLLWYPLMILSICFIALTII